MLAGPLLPKSCFAGLEDVAHLCTGGEAPWLRSHDDACRRFGQLKSAGMAGRDAIFDVYARTKQRVAALLGIPASHVSYLTGQRLDLARCAEIVRTRSPGGAWLAVDATHSLGVAPVDAEVCDFLVCACYKWLLATHGVGIFAYHPARVGEISPNVL